MRWLRGISCILILCFVNCNNHLQLSEQVNDIHTDIYTFLDSLASKKNIVIDTSWYKNRDSAEIGIPQVGDDPDTFVKFPFEDISMTYNSLSLDDNDQPQCFFVINNRKLTDSIGNDDNHFSNSIYKITYKGGKYLIFTGNPRHFNGSGDRINVNYFVDISDTNIVMDIYENSWGYVKYPLLYGDLNNDGQLDRIKFDGVWPSIDTVCVVRIDAETYQGKKWEPLKDRNGQPYFIELYSDAYMENLKLKVAHWMNPIRNENK